MNYFELLGLEEKYCIDKKALDKQYFAMQRKYHPDSSNTASIRANDLNTAYSTLKDDLKRAVYMLNLNGVDIDAPSMRHSLSKEQLARIWEEREELEADEDVSKLQANLKSKILEKEATIEKLILSFQKNKIKEAVDITITLRYLTNLINDIKVKINKCNL